MTAWAGYPAPAPAQTNPPAAVPPANPAPLPPVDSGPPSAQKELDLLSTTLNDPVATQSQRDEAARRLVSRQSPEADRVLRQILEDLGNRNGQLAVARALATDARPDPMFIPSLFTLLGPDRELTEAGAMALADYKNSPEVFTRLANFATARQQREGVRTATIKAIGTLVDKRAAETLVGLLTRENEGPAVRNAAADALADMTGLRENGRDAQRWQQWWAANAGKSEEQWKADLLYNRAARFDQLQIRHQQLTKELQAILSAQYQAVPEAQKPDVVMRYLKSPEPEVRVVGANLVYEDATNNVSISAAAKERLRALVGDSSSDVRLAAAIALRAINDSSALDPLLTQLSQEPDTEVRAALASALAPIRDMRAVPELLKLLNDPSNSVATAAADALKELGPLLREKDPAMATRTAADLRNVLENRTGGPGTESLRESCVEALAPLRDPQMLNLFYKLLSPRESVRVRRAAIKALGELQDPNAADVITNSLEDPEASVRLEAVVALGKTATFAHAEKLYPRLSPLEEPDPSVREQAWLVLQSLLPQAPKEQLMRWADRFKDDPGRRIAVLLAVAEKLVQEKDEDQLAAARQNIGESYMNPKLNQPAEAAPYFRLALNHWREKKVQGMVTEGLVEQLMDAYLRSRQYAEAIKFANETIAIDPAAQQTMAAKIWTEAQRLRDINELQNALLLIKETRKMSPPMPENRQRDLMLIKEDIEQRLPANQRTGS